MTAIRFESAPAGCLSERMVSCGGNDSSTRLAETEESHDFLTALKKTQQRLLKVARPFFL